MSTPKVSSAAKAPQAPPALPLDAVSIRRLDDFDIVEGVPERFIGYTETPHDAALALDFLARLHFRRNNEEQAEWASGRRLSDYLYGLAHFVADRRSPEMSSEMETFLSESLEYAAVRVAIALETPERRMDRWRVSLAAGPKAVAS